MAQNNQTSQKKIPIRRCVGCGDHFPKMELVRVVRTPEMEIVLDLNGKKSGRGAYICKKAACLKKARKSKRIETALECIIPAEVYDRMEEEISHG